MDRQNRDKKTEPGRVVPSQPRLQLPRGATGAARGSAMAREEMPPPGEHREGGASFGGLRHGSVKVWSKLMSRNASVAFDRQHSSWGDRFPLGYCGGVYVQLCSKQNSTPSLFVQPFKQIVHGGKLVSLKILVKLSFSEVGWCSVVKVRNVRA